MSLEKVLQNIRPGATWLIQGEPIYENIQWTDESQSKPTQTEIDEAWADVQNKIASSKARAKRDRLLTESDWVTIRATDTGDPVPTEWLNYRQALRDIPDQTGFPEEIEWPQEPQS